MRRYSDTISLLQTIIRDVDEESEFFTKQKLAATVIYKNKIIAIGFNQYKTHTLQKKFSKNDKSIYIHAEIQAMLRSSRFLEWKEMRKSILFVARIKFKKPGSSEIVSGLAKPCIGCQEAIKHFFIPRVIYSLDDSEDYGVLNFEN